MAATQVIGVFSTEHIPKLHECMKFIIFEEECLRQIIRCKYDRVIVLIRFPPTVGDSTICQYISHMYLGIWDMCVEYESTHTSTTVIPLVGGGECGTTLCKFKSREEAISGLIDSGTHSSAVSASVSLRQYRYSCDATDTSAPMTDCCSSVEMVVFDRSSLDVVKFSDDMLYFDEDKLLGLCSEALGDQGTRCAMTKYRRVAMGGTFDRMHSGHKLLLTLALSICSQELTVGVTSETLLKHKSNAAEISSNETRRQNVLGFLGEVLGSGRYTADESTVDTTVDMNDGEGDSIDFVPFAVHLPTLVDPFGPTITNPNMDAIVVSSETISGALKANEIRQERGFAPLAIFVVRRCHTATLSSTFLRKYSK